jgi:hypothetical protein
MITLVLYGRNDAYGYNLHKRAAISLNCMAEVLTDPADEIIFVDYNTPDDFPTFPVAIQDTLTAKARSRLRVLRVRASQHERFRKQTHLACLEPIARNVGIRRSNPKNRWILSTNTDMVFVPRRSKSLSEIVGDLKDTYYHSPRFEVPETLWESVDRMDPAGTIAAFERWGRELHLNEIVYASHPDVLFDGPGDFQLMLRSDLWRIQGFHESMLLGWHVDSNIARRLALLKRGIGNVLDDLYAYHCDHTRQVTPAHRPRGAQNDQKLFFENVVRPDIPEQAKTWGLADEEVEEIPFDIGNAYIAALGAAISEPLIEPTTLGYSGESFNRLDYPVEHVLPFLLDSVASYPRVTKIGWAGAKRSLLERFALAWRELGFSEPIYVSELCPNLGPDLPTGCLWSSPDQIDARCEILVFDWGRADSVPSTTWEFDRDIVVRDVMRAFRAAIRYERERLEADPSRPRRFIGINAINNAVEGVFNNNVGAALTPLATHIRQGFVSEVSHSDLIPMLYAGQAGQKLREGIASLPGIEGYVFYGPYLDLDNFAYRLTLEIGDVKYLVEHERTLDLEVVSNSRLLAYREVTKEDLASGTITLDFFIAPEISDSADWPRIEIRLCTPGNVELLVRKASLNEIEEPVIDDLRKFDCVHLLVAGPAGVREGRSIKARTGVADLMSYGPYFWLAPGRYEAIFSFEVSEPAPSAAIRAYVATHLGRRVLGRAHVEASKPGIATCVVTFDVGDEVPPREIGLLEFQVRTDGLASFSLFSLCVKYTAPLAEQAPIEPKSSDLDVLPQMASGPAGAHVLGAILTLPGAVGMVFSGNDIPMRSSGSLSLSFNACRTADIHGHESGLAIAALGSDGILGYHEVTMDEVRSGASRLNFEDGVDVASLRMRSTGLLEVEISSAALEPRRGEAIDSVVDNGFLKLLDVGRAGRWSIDGSSRRSIISSVPGVADVLAYGPYIRLTAGRYDVTFELEIGSGLSLKPIALDISCDLGRRIIARDTIWPFKSGAVKRTLSFTVPEKPAGDDLYEFRVWAPGRTSIALTGIFMEQRSLIAAG